jgi:GntR family transcriptional regulator
MDKTESRRPLRLFTLQPSSGTPIYRQIVDQVRRLIAGGQLAPGAELPSVRDVATEHTVNPTTISKAYGLLELEGLVERNRGKPMTIAPARRDQSALRQRLKQIDGQIDALVLAARQLDLRAADLAAVIERKMEHES